MSTRLIIPSEILLEIIRLIEEEDLRGTLSSISKCSRQLHALTIPILYRSTYFHAADISLVTFARAVLSRPDFALHVKSFGVEAFNEYATKENHLGPLVLEIIERAIESISGDDTRGAGRWIRRIELGDRDALSALLILKFPNLEHLNIEFRTTDMCFTKVTKKSEVLTNLTQVEFTNGSRTFHVIDQDYSDFTLRDISPLFHFIKLESLQSFTAQMYRGPTFDFTLFEPESLSIDDLFFVECDLAFDDLIKMLGWFGRIRRLHFDHRCGRSEYSYGRVPRDISIGVAHLKDCLEELVITDQTSRLSVSGSTPIESFVDYQVLKALELPGFSIWAPQRHLKDILPRSLESLTVNYCDNEIGAARIAFFGQLKELAQKKSVCFPNLSKIGLEIGWNGLIEMDSYDAWSALPEEDARNIEQLFEKGSWSYREVVQFHEALSVCSPEELDKVFACGIQEFEQLSAACDGASVKLVFLGLTPPEKE